MITDVAQLVNLDLVQTRSGEVQRGGGRGGVMHGHLVVSETQFASAIWQMKIWTWDRPQRPFVSASVTTQFVDDFEVILRVGEGGTWGGVRVGIQGPGRRRYFADSKSYSELKD